MANPTASAAPPPSVTVFCGFLGAGKTTLLNHLLAQAEGRRWAAVVNDVAAINIDAGVVRAGGAAARSTAAGNREPAAVRDVVELGNGCVCCSSKDELAETLAELASTGRPGGPPGEPYEHIFVETTGVAEPRAIANLFVRKNPFGRTLGQFATLSALVSVVDAAHFLREWTRYRTRRVSREVIAGGERPVFELMIEQVECADLLVLNKADLVTAGELAQLEEILRGLNAQAELVRTERGQLASEFLLGRVRFDAKVTLSGAQWLRRLNAVAPHTVGGGGAGGGSGQTSAILAPGTSRARPTHEAKYGIGTCVYQARRPFVAAKFRQLLETGIPGLLRAKGFYWTREQPDEMGFASVAGGVVRFDLLNYWWAALVENGRARRADLPESIVPLWQEPHGDRRQELVFIGVCLDGDALQAALADCLS